MPWSYGWPHPLPPMWLPHLLWLCLLRLLVPSAPAASGGTKVNSMTGWQLGGHWERPREEGTQGPQDLVGYREDGWVIRL